MKEIEIKHTGRPKLEGPVFVEGLPGVGNVGKLAAEHLIDELGAKKFADIYSKDLPPQVFVEPQGVVRLVRMELFAWNSKKKNQRDIVVLTGDYQPMSNSGQYELVDSVLDILEKFGTKEIFTLGGYGLGRMVSKPGVLGAATSKQMVTRMEKQGVKFKEDEPGGGIIGASGLFLGMGQLRGMQGACLMGETSGYLVDPKSAQAVLEVLAKVLGVTIKFDELEAKAKEMDRIASQLRDVERKQSEKPGDEIRYIG